MTRREVFPANAVARDAQQPPARSFFVAGVLCTIASDEAPEPVPVRLPDADMLQPGMIRR